MMVKRLLIRLFAFVVFGLCGMPAMAQAIDPPHPEDCLQCHNVVAPSYPTLLGTLCEGCHFVGGPAPAVATHSSRTTSTDYGDWDLDCWNCHNPHHQEQDRYWGSTYGKYLKRYLDEPVKEIDPLDPGPYYEALSTLRTVTSDIVEYKGPTEFVDGDAETDDDICQVCHENTSNYNRLSAVNSHTDYGPDSQPGGDCASCHSHADGFRPSAAGQAHDTHLNEIHGPNIDCVDCHGAFSPPLFADGNDLATTTTCDSCHSPSGAFDGVNDLVIGAKNNWPDGVYTGNNLTPGKERWCVGCHDLGTSVIAGRQAPDVAGNDAQTYGFYVSGHGIEATECGDCHGLKMDHNFDGLRTYDDAALNYKQGYRLADVGGLAPMNIPTANDGCGYSADDYRLCFSCHNEQALIQDSKADGVSECTTNPYNNAAAITTGFRNEVYPEGYNWGPEDVPANIHWDHLVDIHAAIAGTSMWDSDGDGTRDSEATCMTCHNPHGERLVSSANPTIKMTRASLDIQWGTDGIGDYGGNGSNVNWPCFTCHGGSGPRKYYRAESDPILDSITIADNNAADPAAAETGYSNSTSVLITITNSGPAATEMRFAENPGFTVNPTGWLPFSTAYTYTMTSGEGLKTIYARLRNGGGNSDVEFDSIVLDTADPVVGNSVLTSPNGGESWLQDSLHDITWTTGDISDLNLQASPVSFQYSTNSGGSFPNGITTGEANDGIYQWTVAPVESSAVRVRLTATDKAGNQGSDSSDADFTIVPVTPVLGGISLADNNNADPAPAEAGFTNSQSITVTISASNNPTQMMLAEDSGFSVNATGWIAFSSTYTYSLTAGEGSRTVYCKVKNGAGESGSQNDAIVLDITPPVVQTDTLTAPNGNADPLLAEYWPINSSQSITWNTGNITDINLGATPVSFKYSTNSGASYFTTIGSDEANDGAYTWNPLPSSIRFTSRVQLIATDQAGNQATDESDNDFKVSPPYKFIITDTGDTNTLGTLRYALNNMEDNAIIWFRLTSVTNEVAEINIGSDLPNIDNSLVTFDGDSQQKLVGNDNPNGPEVRIKGPGAGTSADAFYFNFGADDGWLENLQITGFHYAAYSSGDNFVILGSQFGFGSDSSGYSTDASLRNLTGIVLTGQSNYAYIGAAGPNRNYIACSNGTGLVENGTNNEIGDNIFGILPDDATECANTSSNINMASSGSSIRNNTLCGGGYGISVNTSDNMTVKGNTFGVRYDGSSWIDCTDPTRAIYFQTGSSRDNIIGGPLVALSDSSLRDSNVIDPAPNQNGGITIRGTSSIGIPTKIYGNFIGTNPEQDEVFAGDYGVYSSGSSSAGPAYIGGYEAGEAGNVIANMAQHAIYLYKGGAFSLRDFGINRNTFYGNGNSNSVDDDAIYLPRWIAGDGSWANNNIVRPTIDSATTTQVTVSGVSFGMMVEVYISDYAGSGSEYGEGRTFVGSATAGGATVVVPVSGVSSLDWVTATKTQFNGAKRETSEFSANVQVP